MPVLGAAGGACCLPRRRLSPTIKYFLVLWLAQRGSIRWVGVSKAGYSIKDEELSCYSSSLRPCDRLAIVMWWRRFSDFLSEEIL